MDGKYAIDTMLRRKKSVITVDNNDDMCCARAIVTIKAYRDLGSRHPDFRNLLKGHPIQGIKAKELHRLADVPEGPCGIPEIEKFQVRKSPINYPPSKQKID